MTGDVRYVFLQVNSLIRYKNVERTMQLVMERGEEKSNEDGDGKKWTAGQRSPTWGFMIGRAMMVLFSSTRQLDDFGIAQPLSL